MFKNIKKERKNNNNLHSYSLLLAVRRKSVKIFCKAILLAVRRQSVKKTKRKSETER